MDTLLFNLLILQTVCDSRGRVWRVNFKDLYAIEVTIPQVCYEEYAALEVHRMFLYVP